MPNEHVSKVVLSTHTANIRTFATDEFTVDDYMIWLSRNAALERYAGSQTDMEMPEALRRRLYRRGTI